MAHVGAAWAMVALVAAGENLLTNVNFTETSTATKTGWVPARVFDHCIDLHHIPQHPSSLTLDPRIQPSCDLP